MKLRISFLGALMLGAATTCVQASSDILKQLDRVGSLQNRSASDRDPGPFPSTAPSETKIQWLYAKIRQEAALGNSDRVIELYRDLVKITDATGGNIAAQARNQLAGELSSAGFVRESMVLREENKEFFKNNVGLRISNLGSIARVKMGNLNDLEGAQKDLQEMELELKSASATAREPEFVNIWLAGFEWTKGVESRSRGRFAEAVAYFRGAADRYQRYADNLGRLTKQYKYNDQKEPILNARDFLLLDAGNALRWMGRAVEAETQLKQLLTDQINRSARPANIYLTASTLALTLMNQGRWADAEKVQKRAEEILRQSGLPETSLRYSQAKSSYIPIYMGLQRWSDAYRAYEESEKMRATRDVEGRKRGAAPELTLVFLKANKLDQAHAHAKRVLELESQRFGKNSYRVREAEGFMAMVLKAQGKRDEAEALFRDAVPRLLDPQRDLSGSGAAFLRLKIRHIVEAYLDLLASSSKQGNTAKNSQALVFWLSEAVRGSTVQRAISGAAARFAASDARLADLVRQEQDLSISIEDLQRKIGDLYSTRLAPEEVKKIAAQMRQQIEANEGSRRTISDQITKDFPEYASLVRPRSPSLSEMSAVLKPDESYISIYVGFEKTYITAIKSDGQSMVHAADLGEKGIEQSVTRLRRSLDPGEIPLGQIPPFDFAVAYSLYDKLLKPLASVVNNASTWTVSTTGALGSLPLAVLLTAPYKASADSKLLFAEYKAAPWLNRKVAIAYNPSAAAMIALRKLPQGSATRKAFFGIGDPQFGRQTQVAAGGTRSLKSAPFVLRNLKIPRTQENNLSASISSMESTSSGSRNANLPIPSPLGEAARIAEGAPSTRSLSLTNAATTAVPDIPPLPDTRDEIRAIAASLGADPDKDAIYGAEATRERIKTMNLADKRIIAFATHGLIPGDMPGLTQPALTLAYEKDPRDSLLLLEDILKLRLDADWVVLSACNTGAADGLGNEAASGLGRGFFYAGSRALLLTHWPVESESAKRLVTQIFTLYSNQTPRAIAVKKSADMLIDSPGYLDPQSNKLLYSYAHPMFWAPYTLIGDSR